MSAECFGKHGTVTNVQCAFLHENVNRDVSVGSLNSHTWSHTYRKKVGHGEETKHAYLLKPGTKRYNHPGQHGENSQLVSRFFSVIKLGFSGNYGCRSGPEAHPMLAGKQAQ
eukprot:1153277-Pelagomonas_calceolata.AAC.12